MLSRQPAALQAKSLLHHAANYLQTSSPASDSDLSRIMDSSMYLPLGDPAYAGHRLVEPNYTENSADSLSFVMDAAEPGSNPQDRIESTTDAMSRVIENHFGGEALNWFKGRSEPVADIPNRAATWGASFGSIRCGRYNGTQQVTLAVESAMPLVALQPLMESLGLGHQHGSLMSAC